MSRYIGQYVSICDLCLRTKPWRHSPVGELQPLSIPDARWDTLSVDFVVELPESSEHDAVMTVIDSVSKRVHFVPMHTTVTVEGVARLFLYHVWKLHGLPKRVVSDHGKRGKRDIYCDKQVGKAVTVLNCVLKGSWGEEGSRGIRKKLKSEYTAYLKSKYRRNDGNSI